MALYSIYADIATYACIRFNREELREKFGVNPKHHIDAGFKPIPYLKIWQSVIVTFESLDDTALCEIPDITMFKTKLFLNKKAYNILYPIMKECGEFLPVSLKETECFIFNPLRTAEELDAVNEVRCTKNEWGDITSIGFYENRLTGIPIFKSKVDQYQSLNCTDAVKSAIEDNDLHGVYFTEDLGCPHTANISAHIKTN